MIKDTTLDRRKLLQGAAAAGIIGTTGCLSRLNGDGGGNGEGDGVTWTLGTSSEGSSSFRIGSTFAQYLQRNNLTDTVEIEAVITEGTGASYRRVDAGEYEMGGSATMLLENSPDEGQYEDEPLENFDQMRQIGGYMGFYNFGLVNTDAAEGWEDLEGSAVAISSSGAATRPLKEAVVDSALGLDNIDPRYMSFSDMPAALRSGNVDAAFTWFTNREIAQGWFEEIDATVNWAPLELPDETITMLEEDMGFSDYVQLSEDEVSNVASNYQGPIDTFTLGYMWVCLAERDPEIVHEIARLRYEHADELIEQDEIMTVFGNPDEFFGLLHPDVPVHEGAYNYYQEEGLWDEYANEYNLTAPPEGDE